MQYGCEMYLCARTDAFDTWALCKILRIPIHLSYNKSRSQGSVRVSPLSNMATEQRLRFFGHIARSASGEDHYCAVAAAIRKPPPDRKRPPGRPNHMWLRATESDLRLQNIGPLESREHGWFDCGHGYAQADDATKR